MADPSIAKAVRRSRHEWVLPSILFAQAKKLKAAGINRRLDYIARKFVRRVPIGRDDAYRAPRLELTR